MSIFTISSLAFISIPLYNILYNNFNKKKSNKFIFINNIMKRDSERSISSLRNIPKHESLDHIS